MPPSPRRVRQQPPTVGSAADREVVTCRGYLRPSGIRHQVPGDPTRAIGTKVRLTNPMTTTTGRRVLGDRPGRGARDPPSLSLVRASRNRRACLAEVGTDGPTTTSGSARPPAPGGWCPGAGERGVVRVRGARCLWGQRGHLRTTIRDLRASASRRAWSSTWSSTAGHGAGHGTGHGPGCAWAAGARVGDQVVLVGPRRGHPSGGIEFAPGQRPGPARRRRDRCVPAVAAILEQLPASMTGAAFEVPDPADVQTVRHPRRRRRDLAPRGSTAHGCVARGGARPPRGAPGGAAGGPGPRTTSTRTCGADVLVLG